MIQINSKLKILFYLIVLILYPISSFANIEWADTLIETSGNYNVKEENAKLYSAIQLLGKPSVMLDFGKSPCAWTPKISSEKEFVILGFKKAMKVRQISIFESFHPGAITKVTLFNDDTSWVVYQNELPAVLKESGKILNIYPKIKSKVDKIRIEVNTIFHKGLLYQIDAVAISDKKTNILPKINLSKDVLEVGELENLGLNINSDYAELAPVISSDGKVIYFTREGHPKNTGKQSIWCSQVDENDKFQAAKNIGEPLNTKNINFVISVLPSGDAMLVGNVYKADGSQDVGFSMTYKDADEWSFPKELEIEGFYNNKRGSYSLASNGKVLILSLEQNKGFGKNDLFVSFLKEDGKWSLPKNIGKDINTAASEASPFLAADGVTLYFSSAGYPGYGSNDIFVTRRLDESWEKWSEPVNLGNKINTKNWDAYFTVPASGYYAYFVSSAKGSEDIYRAKLPEELQPEKVGLVSGKVLNKKTQKPLAADITYEKLSTGEVVGKARSNPITGEYKIILPGGTRYAFRAEVKDFISINESLDLMNLKHYDEIEKNLYLVPIEKGQKLPINNIFFELGSYELKDESAYELKRIADIMLKRSSMRIQIVGHTDNIGSEQDNILLSQRRASSVKEALVGFGVNGDRITTDGLGFSQPIATNKTKEGRAKNRRVELRILK